MDQNYRFERLGPKTFRVFILERLGLFVGVALAMAALAYVRQFAPLVLQPAIDTALPIGFLVALAALGLGVGAAWLEYTHYSIFLDEQAIKVRRGIVTVEEVGFPFKRIKAVRLVRSLTDQLLGVGSLVITSGVEESESDIKVSLPSLGSELAETLQGEILRRSAIEDVRTVPSTTNQPS